MAMRTLLLLVLLACSGAAAELLTLGDGNFTHEVLSKDAEYLVGFVAPWCAHSRQLQAQLLELTEQQQQQQREPPLSGLRVAVVDCEANPMVASLLQMRSFPAVYYFRDGGSVRRFVRNVSADDVQRYLNTTAWNATAGSALPKVAPFGFQLQLSWYHQAMQALVLLQQSLQAVLGEAAVLTSAVVGLSLAGFAALVLQKSAA